MKKYIQHIWVLTVIAFLAPSCESFLEEELVTVIAADTYYATPDGFDAAVNATYEFSRRFFAQEIGGTMTVFGTDIFTNGADGSHKGFNQ
ncbi:MAG: RagB/SusD family nutrient uptake outer membrane protein, partial [Bacteroidota bacterium]